MFEDKIEIGGGFDRISLITLGINLVSLEKKINFKSI